MKAFLAALFSALPVAVLAVDAPLAFPDAKIDAPALTLVENSLHRPLPNFVSDFGRQQTPTVVVSRMPIINPRSDLDPKMVKAPDPSVDYKLIIKSPDVAPAK